jgi:hypothetical protein
MEVSLLYAQAVHSVVRCDALPVSEKVALQLAGLQAQAALGDPEDRTGGGGGDEDDLYHDVDLFLPQRIKAGRFGSGGGDNSSWVPILKEAHRHYGRGLGEIEAKAWYLRCVMQYPTYGSTLFPVAYKGYWSHGSSLVLGINVAGLLLLRPTAAAAVQEQQAAGEAVLFQFPYREIESILLDPRENFVTVTLHRNNGIRPTADGQVAGVDQQRVFVLETAAKAEVGALVASYCPALANWIREAEAPPVRKFNKQVPEQYLHRYLVLNIKIISVPSDKLTDLLRQVWQTDSYSFSLCQRSDQFLVLPTFLMGVKLKYRYTS